MCVLAGCAWAEAAPAARLTFTVTDQEASPVLATLTSLAGTGIDLDLDLLVAGVGGARPLFALCEASPAGVRQAVAHALDCWWVTARDGGVVLLRSRRLPQGPLSVRSLTSSLRNQPAAEALVRRLLDPWLGGEAGVSLLPADGLWTGTLDQAGHARMIEAINLIERPLAQVTSLLPDPDAPDLDLPVAGGLRATGWGNLVELLSARCRVSASLSPRLRARSFPVGGLDLRAARLGDLARELSLAGIAGSWRHGVLCLDDAHDAGDGWEREHPAQRRRLALVPVGHLVADAVDGDFIVAAIRTRVATWWWAQPGAELCYQERTRSLLVAADAGTQVAVLDALALFDRLGLRAGLQALAASAGGR
jgi:hypothetical protein